MSARHAGGPGRRVGPPDAPDAYALPPAISQRSRPASPPGRDKPGRRKSSRGGTADSHIRTSLSRSTRDATVCRHPVVALDVACRRAAAGCRRRGAGAAYADGRGHGPSHARLSLGGGGCRASGRGACRPPPVALSAGKWYACGCPELHCAGFRSGPYPPQTTEADRSWPMSGRVELAAAGQSRDLQVQPALAA